MTLAGVPVVSKPIFPSVISLDFDDPKDVVQKCALLPGFFGDHFESHLPRPLRINIVIGEQLFTKSGLLRVLQNAR